VRIQAVGCRKRRRGVAGSETRAEVKGAWSKQSSRAGRQEAGGRGRETVGVLPDHAYAWRSHTEQTKLVHPK